MKNYMYILECSDNSLYTGWTNDLAKRIKAHNSGRGAKYTKSRRPVRLCYWETFETKQEAMSREARVKRMSRAEKMEMLHNGIGFSEGSVNREGFSGSSVNRAGRNAAEGITKQTAGDDMENIAEGLQENMANRAMRAMRIRPVSDRDDRMAVSRVYEESWKEAYRNIVPQAYLDNIPAGAWCEAAFRPNMHSLVMTDGEEIVGTASYCKMRLFDMMPDKFDSSETKNMKGKEGEGGAKTGSIKTSEDSERTKNIKDYGDMKAAENCGEIVSIYFLPQYMGKGFGTLLMQAVLAELKKMGYQSCCLWVLEENGRARRFYEKMGFIPDGAYMEQEIGGKNLREMRYVRGVLELG